ncbi:MAG: class I SAM-dependent methyltransferase [Spirochaetaceae bacterium]
MSEYVYEPFADSPEYREVNEMIVRRWMRMITETGTRQIDRLLDLATGVGTMVDVFLKNLPAGLKQPSVLCVDQSSQALEQTERRLKGRVHDLQLKQGLIEELDLPKESVDVAIWGNGIHYLDEEAQFKALTSVRRVLKPGGWFFFNSAFYADSRPEETLPFYRAQIAKAVRKLKALGVGRDSKEKRVEASNFLDQAYYQRLLEQTGFAVQEMKKIAARLYRSAWESISGFSQYAAGALHGYPVDLAAEVLSEAVEPSLEEHGTRDENGELYIPRNWLSAAARVEK